MIQRRTIRSTMARAAMVAAIGCALLGASARAQVSSYGDKEVGENSGDQLPQVLQKVGVEQHLNRPLPLDAQFVDDHGNTVRLGDYFGKHPAILSLVYYNCPMLCSEEMDGLAGALEMVKMNPGKDFEVIIISIDPSETPELAAKKKAFYVKRYGRPSSPASSRRSTPSPMRLDLVTYACPGRTASSTSLPTPAPSSWSPRTATSRSTTWAWSIRPRT